MNDVFLWRNIYVSASVFALLFLFIILVKSYEYSFVTLVGRLLQLQVLVFSAYFFGMRFIKGSDNVPNPFQNIQLSEEDGVKFVKKFINIFNDYAKAYGEILYLVDWKKTLKFVSLLQVACFFGNRIRGINLLLALVLYLFTVPKVYEMKKKEIDQIIEMIQGKVTQQVDQLVQKIPPQYKEKLESFFGKKDKQE